MRQAEGTTAVAEPEAAAEQALAIDLDRARQRAQQEPWAAAAKLETRHLTVRYGAFTAVRDVSLSFPERQVTAIIGPSGSGKSTLLRALNRMHDAVPGVATEGQVLLDGLDLYAPEVDPILVRRRIGMVFQRPNPFAKSIFDNVAYGLRFAGRQAKATAAAQVERALRQAGLWDEVHDRLNRAALGLSGGQQQRLCIARALAVEPEVLLMDEPTSALDPIATLRIEELMRDLVETHGYTVVTVTHNMQQAARVSDLTAFMTLDEGRAGVLVEVGETAQLFTAPRDPRTEAYITGRVG
ncbi:MAG TPA: phosphate ABC transporter ATP-binding protein PstB [Thermomicrobiaceae bacterium]|nr:phosphate ABC transporter ATP-binding protein PstB [Thermomicrobiaceae bacterium]